MTGSPVTPVPPQSGQVPSTVDWSRQRVLVTGGAGFLGRAITVDLLSRGAQVRILQRSAAPDLTSLGVECISGDLREPATVQRSVTGCTMVFHVAAKAGVWGPAREYQAINAQGTQNVVAACLAAGCQTLVYTSSPSVVYGGQHERGIDESAPYPAHYLTEYPRTKAQAERAVLAAHGQNLHTVALRPHLIWGPGDQHLFPRLIARARANRLRRVGSGQNRVDAVYIDNAALAHRLAAEELLGAGRCGGRAYFITNGEPVLLWELIDQLLAVAGLPPVQRSISASSAYRLGAILEGLWWLTRQKSEPPMTRFVARQLATDHWYSIVAAQRDFGYLPQVSMQAGLERLGDWWQQQSVKS